MRKLLVFAVFLAMAPIASGMYITLSDTGTSVELTVTHAIYDPIFAVVIEAPGNLSAFAATAQGTKLGDITINGDSGEAWGFVEPYVDGVWLTADWSAPSKVKISVYETFDNVDWDLLRQILVPEPMTAALLGLGGLFLLRRRK